MLGLHPLCSYFPLPHWQSESHAELSWFLKEGTVAINVKIETSGVNMEIGELAQAVVIWSFHLLGILYVVGVNTLVPFNDNFEKVQLYGAIW